MNDRKKKHNKSIGFRFLCIIAAFVGIFSCAVLFFSWSSSNAQMEDLLQEKANLVLQFDLAIRSYVSEEIRPFAQAHTGKDEFIPKPPPCLSAGMRRDKEELIDGENNAAPIAIGMVNTYTEKRFVTNRYARNSVTR